MNLELFFNQLIENKNNGVTYAVETSFGEYKRVIEFIRPTTSGLTVRVEKSNTLETYPFGKFHVWPVVKSLQVASVAVSDELRETIAKCLLGNEPTHFIHQFLNTRQNWYLPAELEIIHIDPEDHASLAVELDELKEKVRGLNAFCFGWARFIPEPFK